MARVPIGKTLIEPGSITFDKNFYWVDFYDSWPGAYGKIKMLHLNVLIVGDSSTNPHIAGRFRSSIKSSGTYKLKGKLKGKSPAGTDFKIQALLGGATYDIFLIDGTTVGVSTDITATVTDPASERLGFNLNPEGDDSKDYETIFGSLELYATESMTDPTGFGATLTTSTNVDLSWSLYNNNDIMVAWTSDNSFGTPILPYSAKEEISGGGRVLYVGNNLNYSDTITNGETRYYKIWSTKLGTDEVTYYSTGDSNSIVGNPQTFSGVDDSEYQIDLSWEKNLNSDDILLSRSGSTIGEPNAGTLYPIGGTIPGGGTVIYSGSSLSYSDTDLVPAASYNYELWSISGSTVPNYGYSPGLEITVETTNSIDDPIWDSTEPIYAINSNQIKTTWTGNTTRDLVLLASGLTNSFGTPSGTYSIGDSLGSGTILLNSTDDLTYIDNNNLTPPYTLYYKIWSNGGSDIYSNGTGTTITVDAPTSFGGFNSGKFYGGYFSGDWYGGKWIGGYFLSGATWNSSDPHPRT